MSEKYEHKTRNIFEDYANEMILRKRLADKEAENTAIIEKAILALKTATNRIQELELEIKRLKNQII